MADRKPTRKEMKLILDSLRDEIQEKKKIVNIYAKEKQKYINLVEQALRKDKSPDFVEERLEWLERATEEWEDVSEPYELSKKLYAIAREGNPEKCQWVYTDLVGFDYGGMLFDVRKDEPICYFPDVDGYTGFLWIYGLEDRAPQSLLKVEEFPKPFLAEESETPDRKKTFGQNLTLEIEKKGLTKLEFAKKMDVPQATVSDWMNGNKYPSPEVVSKTADFLGVPAYLLTERFRPDAVEAIAILESFSDRDLKTSLDILRTYKRDIAGEHIIE